MRNTRSFFLSLVLLVGAVALPACVVDDDDVDDSTLTVVNESDFVIEEVFITDVNASGWGPNLLAGDVLFPGESMVIYDIECGVYDALLVDETGLECELLGIDLCFDDATWVITNNTCDVFAAEAARRAQAAQGAQDASSQAPAN